MRARGRAILVEGYMDALRLHMEGFGETVASLGTALSSEQADLIKRFAPRCYICFDADAAGQEAAVRGMYVLQRCGLDVRVVSLPEAKDPDEFLSTPGGAARFAACLDEATPLVEHHLSLRRDALRDPTRREQAAKDILSGVAQLSSLDLAPFVPELAAAFGLFAHQFIELVERERQFLSPSEQGKPFPSDVSITGGRKEEAPDSVEAALLFLLWTDASLRRNASPEGILPLFSEERLRHIVMALLSGETPEELEARWYVIGETYPLRVVALGGEWCARLEGKDVWKTVVGLLEAKRRKRQYEALQLKCRRGEATDEDLLALRNLAQKLKGGKDSV
jgi:DNA primase